MRADKFFAEKFSSRTKAAEALEKGLVLVNGKKIKPSDDVKETDEVSFISPSEYYVSNGGYKLGKALREFSEVVKGMTFADIGASTGGFTDCLLQNGAKKVYCVDVGESLLDASLADRKEIVQMQNTNARFLTAKDFPEAIDGVVVDVSFISLKLILPAVSQIVKPDGVAYVLIKPQFECENKNIGKSGIVKKQAHPKILSSIYDFALSVGLTPCNIVNAPVREKKNIEYVCLLKKSEKRGLSKERFLSLASDIR